MVSSNGKERRHFENLFAGVLLGWCLLLKALADFEGILNMLLHPDVIANRMAQSIGD